jgi:hypothetical protein
MPIGKSYECSRRPLGIKTGKAGTEQLFSGLPRKRTFDRRVNANNIYRVLRVRGPAEHLDLHVSPSWSRP